MILYSIQQSEKGIGKAYLNLLDRLSSHIELLAKEGKPFASIMGIKRQLYSMKRQFVKPEVLNLESSKKQSLSNDMILLIGEVLDKFDIDIQEAVEIGLLGEKEIKKALAKYDYYQLVKKGMTGKDAKAELSEKYGFSVSMLEKLIYVRGNKKR